MKVVEPAGWPPPKGFANGILAEGKFLFVAGQIGRNPDGSWGPDLPGQVEIALRNVAAVLKAAGSAPERVVRMTWYMTDLDDYSARLREIGGAYRAVMGRHFPAMTVIEVRRLVEPRAMVEIEATAEV